MESMEGGIGSGEMGNGEREIENRDCGVGI
jgi:hypothetical protein